MILARIVDANTVLHQSRKRGRNVHRRADRPAGQARYRGLTDRDIIGFLNALIAASKHLVPWQA